jgi:enoyl-CoA hydratase/carnithine racemase
MGLVKHFDGGVLRLVIDRPEVRNALNEDVMKALTDELAAIDYRSPVRAIVLTGSGDKAFCAGADLRPSQATFENAHARPTTVYADLLRTAWHLPVPLVARVNGHCMAGGMGLLAFCDMAVSTSTATFGLPEVKVGLFPMQVAAILQKIMPTRKFAEMCFTGEPISASEALEHGLLNYVVEPDALDAKVDWLVGRIVDKSPTGIRRGKHALRVVASMDFDQSIAFLETQIAVLPLTDDAREGLAAFNEKRAPRWTGC